MDEGPRTRLEPLTLAAIGVVLAEGILLGMATCVSLREYALAAPLILIESAAIVGAIACGAIDRKIARPRVRRAALSAILAVLVLVPASAVWPGGVTYARFGLTVVGACPVPVYDVMIRAGGVPSLRNKTHRVTAADVARVWENDTEVIVIACGWDGAVAVDPDVLDTPGVVVEVLRTPDAVARYNALRREGRRVALILHSTC